MKIQFYQIVLFFCFLNCGNNNKHPFEGRWEYRNSSGYGRIILFKGGSYQQRIWENKAIFDSEGVFFFNENKSRMALTITLIPNLDYTIFDTIILPCENIDLLEITQSNFIARVTIDSTLKFRRIR